ncbi:glucosyl-3-phosphoglycerate synthase [Agilicoccus flavus]|uniref:glucosyl-3-phosphoglycerate synthase n=1 Tax=Agilicoccus flavus TaxID=2775968 RepID=UPI001CF666B7|nr:glucosyl-3-phosphoglycerate synthase [Agilicoccus flavus]
MHPDVSAWLSQRSYDAQQFDAVSLAAAKAGRAVSVVLPARNEQDTVGAIVAAIAGTLRDEIGLVDEILVVDSNSTDATVEVARAAGARVVAQGDVLPQLGDVPGKGEALWKSLAATSGDVLVFVDADLRNFDPVFVVGLLGPVLAHGVHFSKGCYDRPLTNGATVLPAGGGRVTELVARPLLNAHWPCLAGFVQPLAGEYAATRECLESVPFVSGYGVEIGLLVDLLDRYGLDALAQVDLGVREHRNSPDDQLARMAMQIQLTAHERLARQGRIVATEQPSHEMTQFVRGTAGYVARTSDVGFGERPRMLDVPAYLERPRPRPEPMSRSR